MKSSAISRRLRRRALFSAGVGSSLILRLANSAEPGPLALANAAGIELDADGWALIPYGDTHHNAHDGRKAPGAEVPEALRKGVIQRFSRENAEAMAKDFGSLLGRIKRAVVGLPVFKGHPDAPRFANFFRDKTERGTISDMQVTDAGLRLRPVLTEKGAEDVESGWSQFSPYWDLKFSGANSADGLPVYEPFKLHSIGLVPRGNMPGLSLINADLLSPTMKNELIALLALLGITVPPETADDAIAPFIEQAKTKIAEANTAKTKAETDLVTANQAKTKAEGDLATANASIETLKAAQISAANAHAEALKTERRERAVVVVGQAVAEGRVLAAEKDAQILALANAADFAASAAALAALPKKMKTQSAIGDLAQTGREQTDRQTQFLSLVNAKMDAPEIKALAPHLRYDAAFTAISATEEGKALLAKPAPAKS